MCLFISKVWGHSVCVSEFYAIPFGALITAISFELNPQKCLQLFLTVDYTATVVYHQS